MFHVIKKEEFHSLLSSQVSLSFKHLGGVLSQLRNSSSSLAEYLNLFNVKESTTNTGNPKSPFNPDDNEQYVSQKNGTQSQWLQIEMKNLYIITFGYTLMSYSGCCDYPKTWYLEGRNSENERWKRIDERVGETDLKGKNYVKEFKNNKITGKAFKMFRYTIVEASYSPSYTYLTMNEIDFIGISSKDPNPFKLKCQTRNFSNRHYLLISFMILIVCKR